MIFYFYVHIMIRDLDEEKLKKVYDTINKHFKTINRDMLNKIVIKLDDIADMYFDRFDFNDKDRRQIDNTVFTKRILNNKNCQEANSINTILSFILAVYTFKNTYTYNRENLFKGSNTYDYILCATINFDFKKKDRWCFSDDNIPETVEWFLNLPMEEIKNCMPEVE